MTYRELMSVDIPTLAQAAMQGCVQSREALHARLDEAAALWSSLSDFDRANVNAILKLPQ